MNQSNLETSQPAHGTAANTESIDRTAQLSKLYATHYAILQSVAYESYPSLLVFDSERILTALAERLGRYRGPFTEESFLRWATNFVKKETRRYQILVEILTTQDRVIHAAINKAVRGIAQERYIEHEDIYFEVARLIFDKAHSLAKKGTAKLSTRITALVLKHVHFYHRSYWQRRHQLLTERMEQGGDVGCEVLSPEEIASMKAEVYEMESYASYGFIAP